MNVNVSIRVRPLTSTETAAGDTSIVQIHLDQNALSCSFSPHVDPQVYQYDKVFGERDTTQFIYHDIAQPQVQKALNGINCTIFACTPKPYLMLLFISIFRWPNILRKSKNNPKKFQFTQ
jgi:hypothetical protein